MGAKREKLNFDIFSTGLSTGVAYKNRALKKRIIQIIDNKSSSSITELSKEINTSVPKATALVNELIAEGLLQDEGKIDSTGGRRASVYGLVPDACFFLGVDVKKYHINIGLMNFRKRIISNKEKLPFKLENTAESLKKLLGLIKDFLSHTQVERKRVLGCGINLSGRINNRTGHSFSFYHFREEPLAEIIEQEINVPTYLENDSRAMAFGELYSGEISSEKNVLFVNMDYGIGLGIVLDGKVYYGRSGFSGEFGHIPLFNNEIICQCGKKGCLETEASGNALIRKFKERIKKGSTSSVLKNNKSPEQIGIEDIINGANNEDTLCIELLSEIGEKLGKGLAVLINIFNPELIILGGTLSETGDYLGLPSKNALNKLSLSLVNNDTSLKMSKLGEKAGVIGACLIARSKVMYN
ncbi:MAG: ROK family transcriptional regulator [Chitinophagia bacterium]|jgi:glucokinase-like ROK family protein